MALLPFEFVVQGVPRSQEARSVGRWKERVRAAAAAAWPSGQRALSDELSVAIVYFHVGQANIDVENMAKPILDALVELVYWDDRVVSEVVSRRTPLDEAMMIEDAYEELVEALRDAKDVVYVAVRDRPDHGRLP